MEHAQLSPCDRHQIGWEALGKLASKNLLGSLVTETPDHRFAPIFDVSFNDTQRNSQVASPFATSGPSAHCQ
jgi:hypothetical protein